MTGLKRRLLVCVTLVLVLIVAGCGSEKAPVLPPIDGQVILKDFPTAEKLLPFPIVPPLLLPISTTIGPLFRILNPEPRIPEDGEHYEFVMTYSGSDFRLLEIRETSKPFELFRIPASSRDRKQIMRDVEVIFREVSNISSRPVTNEPIPGSRVWWEIEGVTYSIFAVNIGIGDVLGVADSLIEAAQTANSARAAS